MSSGLLSRSFFLRPKPKQPMRRILLWAFAEWLDGQAGDSWVWTKDELRTALEAAWAWKHPGLGGFPLHKRHSSLIFLEQFEDELLELGYSMRSVRAAA